jgi:hypothetical protein
MKNIFKMLTVISFLLAALSANAGPTEVPRDTALPHALTLKITDTGLSFVGSMLAQLLVADQVKQLLNDSFEGYETPTTFPAQGGELFIGISPYEESDEPIRYEEAFIDLYTVPNYEIPAITDAIYFTLMFDNFSGETPNPTLDLYIRYDDGSPPLYISSGVELNIVTYGAIYPVMQDDGLAFGYTDFKTDTVLEYVAPVAGIDLSALLEALLQGPIDDTISNVLEAAVRLVIDPDNDKVPDPLFDLDIIMASISDLAGLEIEDDFNFDYMIDPVAPGNIYLTGEGKAYLTENHSCIDKPLDTGFRYTYFEADGNIGEDPPTLPEIFPGSVSDSYMVGATISDDLINLLLFNIYAAGMLCLTVDGSDQSLPPDLRSFMNLSAFVGILSTLGIDIFNPVLDANGDGEISDEESDVPLAFTVKPGDAPYVVLPDDGETIELVVPNLVLDFYLWLDNRPVRGFSLLLDFTGDLIINNLDFSADPFYDIEIGASGSAKIIFNELFPGQNEQVESLVATVIGMLGSMVTDLGLGDTEIAALQLLSDFRTERFAVISSGKDADENYNHYLNVYFSADPSSTIDFDEIITQLLETLIETSLSIRQLSSIDGTPFMKVESGDSAAVDLSPLAEELNREGSVLRWRIDQGFWQPYPESSVAHFWPILQGQHSITMRAIDITGADTVSEKKMIFSYDTIPPAITFAAIAGGMAVSLYDWQTPDVAATFSIDNGVETALPENGIISAAIGSKIEVCTTDQSNNRKCETEIVSLHNANPEQANTGCNCRSTAPSTDLWFLLPLLIPIFRPRRRSARSNSNR